MDEAKSLVNMAVSAIFSGMIIGGVLLLIGLGYTMWSYFSRQDAANQKMKDYVNYVAYDDTTIRGQEVISLYQYAEQEGLFIALWDNTSGTSMDSLTLSGASLHLFIPDTCPWESIQTSATKGHIPTPLGVYVNTVNGIKSNSRTGARVTCCSPAFYVSGKLSYDRLVQCFTNNHSNWSHLGGMNSQGTPTKSYAAYRSYLVYDSDTSSDVIGFILMRQNKTVTDFD